MSYLTITLTTVSPAAVLQSAFKLSASIVNARIHTFTFGDSMRNGIYKPAFSREFATRFLRLHWLFFKFK